MKRRLRAIGLALMILGLSICGNAEAWTERYVEYDCSAPCGVDEVGCGTSAADSCQTLEYYLESEGVSAGERINIKYDGAADTQVGITTDITMSVDGTGSNRIVIQGYSSTVGDGTQAVIDGESSATNIFLGTTGDYWIFKDLELKGSTGDAIEFTSSADVCIFENVKISSAGAKGIDTAGETTFIINSDITATTYAVDTYSGNLIFKSYLHDCSLGVYFDGSFIIDSIIDTTSGHGIHIDADNSRIWGTTIYNSGDDNLFIDPEYGNIIIDNIFSEMANENIDNNGDILIYGYNCLHDTTAAAKSGTIYFDLGGEQLDVDPEFDTPASADFNIGDNLDDDGMPGQIGTSTNTNEIGALPYEETAGAACTNAFGVIQ